VRVVITGATGNLGTALLESVIAADVPSWQVVGVARRRPENVPPYTRASWDCCDVGAESAVDRLGRLFRHADVVIHLAWAIQPSAGEPPMRRTNLTGTGNVLRAAAACGVPQMVCASSVAAYGPAPRHRLVPETWPTDGIPGSAYSGQKAELERMLDRFEAGHPAMAVGRIRPCAITSGAAGAQLASWMVSPLLPTAAVGRAFLPVPVWPGLRVQVVHARDVADAIYRMVRTGASGPFNLAAEPVVQRQEMARAGIASITLPYRAIDRAADLAWRAGLQPLHHGWLRLADQAALVDTARAREELGWAPRIAATTAVREMIEAVRETHKGRSAPLAPARRKPFPVGVRIGRPMRQSQHESG
jgi:UDP-glucose 4-epimerase